MPPAAPRAGTPCQLPASQICRSAPVHVPATAQSTAVPQRTPGLLVHRPPGLGAVRSPPGSVPGDRCRERCSGAPVPACRMAGRSSFRPSTIHSGLPGFGLIGSSARLGWCGGRPMPAVTGGGWPGWRVLWIADAPSRRRGTRLQACSPAPGEHACSRRSRRLAANAPPRALGVAERRVWPALSQPADVDHGRSR